jgi:hypothetical protein
MTAVNSTIFSFSSRDDSSLESENSMEFQRGFAPKVDKVGFGKRN